MKYTAVIVAALLISGLAVAITNKISVMNADYIRLVSPENNARVYGKTTFSFYVETDLVNPEIALMVQRGTGVYEFDFYTPGWINFTRLFQPANYTWWVEVWSYSEHRGFQSAKWHFTVVSAPQCNCGDVKCENGTLYRCENGSWFNTGKSCSLPVAATTQTHYYTTAGEPATLDATPSYDPDGEIVSYEWKEPVSGEILGTTPTVSVTFNSYGSYPILLTVKDNDGLTASKYVVVVVEKNYYHLNVIIVPEGAGSVELNPPGGNYNHWDRVTLTAIPNEGYAFSHWAGGASGSNNPTTIIMSANVTVYAYFEELSPNQYILNISVSPPQAGWVEATPSGGVYNAGTVVTLTAYPNAGYRFKEWEGATGTNTTTIVMDGNKTVTAVFEKITYGYNYNYIAGFIFIGAIVSIAAVLLRRKL